MAASPEFEFFRASCFDDSFGATRDGLDVEAALSLSGSERAEAEALVLSSLPQTNDSRPFTASGVMRIGAASPILKARLCSGFASRHEYLRVHAAHALYLIEKWSDAATTIIDVLKDTPKTPDRQWTRMMAVEALGDFADDSRCQAALFVAVEDEDNFIGFLAIQSLKKIFSHSAAISALLETLRDTQVEPHRWKPEFLRDRRRAFLELESATGIRMPAVAMERKTEAQQDAAPNSRPASQLSLLPDIQASDSQRTPSSGGCG
jgi:HEAT repeat protein